MVSICKSVKLALCVAGIVPEPPFELPADHLLFQDDVLCTMQADDSCSLSIALSMLIEQSMHVRMCLEAYPPKVKGQCLNLTWWLAWS